MSKTRALKILSQSLNPRIPNETGKRHDGKSEILGVAKENARAADIRAATKLLKDKTGLSSAEIKDITKGYTWHHNENLGTMELVQTAAHKATHHDGGRAIQNLLELEGIYP